MKYILLIAILFSLSGCNSGLYNDKGLDRLQKYVDDLSLDLPAFSSPIPEPIPTPVEENPSIEPTSWPQSPPDVVSTVEPTSQPLE